MRFQQLKRYSNVILKKKMYKSGRNWIVKSTLSLASGLALFGVSQLTTVQADTTDLTPVSQATSESVEQPQNGDKDVNADPAAQLEQTKEDVSGQNADVPQGEEIPDKNNITPVTEMKKSATKSDEPGQQEALRFSLRHQLKLVMFPIIMNQPIPLTGALIIISVKTELL
ncbi:KxYKxGKxW signal peptide domain-containing protein [Companilactobacillus muriivasis]|uniref:KxYKxGKxW signal peptide domain-containing protein n=1 Tax=Companilactobacillus muriivasis TaxID=3081444 RepID=UPI0030C7420A